MIKICHLISAFDRYDTRIFWKQCRSLVNAGYDVSLVTNDNGKFELADGVKIIPSGFHYSNRLQRILFSRKINLEKALEINADIYQIHDPEFIPLGLKLLKKGKCVIFDSHEDFPKQILEKNWVPIIFRRILSKLAEQYFNKYLGRFDAVLSVTPHIAESLQKASRNVYCITNYPIINKQIDTPSFENYYLRKNSLCYAGTIYRSSLQENIITAISELNNLIYTIVGNISADYKSVLLPYLDKDFIILSDFVPLEQLKAIYNNSTIGIAIFDYSPNLGYKIGSLGVNKIFEYMNYSLPVICTDFILWKEMIDKYKCGIYVNPHSVEEIRNAINFLLTNKEEAYQMGQNGRRAVLEEFNWGTQERIYIEMIKKISLTRNIKSTNTSNGIS